MMARNDSHLSSNVKEKINALSNQMLKICGNDTVGSTVAELILQINKPMLNGGKITSHTIEKYISQKAINETQKQELIYITEQLIGILLGTHHLVKGSLEKQLSNSGTTSEEIILRHQTLTYDYIDRTFFGPDLNDDDSKIDMIDLSSAISQMDI